MSPRNRSILLTILVAFTISYMLLVVSFYYATKNYAISQAEDHIQDSLLTHRAIHTYVEDIQKPEFYRLKEEGKLYKEYFSPKVLSFTYIARHIKNFLNEERKEANLPQIYFKLAAGNPRNPINKGDEFELELLEKMNKEGLTEYKQLHEQEGMPHLYYAIPINPNKKTCQRCHGVPQDAPRELLDRYGPERGFYERTGDIRAMISIRIPLSEHLEEAKRVFWGLSVITLLILASIFGTIWFFIRRLDKKEQIILKKNIELEHLSSTDNLTGLYNRMRFNEWMEREIARAIRHDTPLSLIMIDIDHFKEINDNCGHAAGDDVLVTIAEILEENTRETDIVARWGGEEFIIATHHTDLHGAERLAEQLRATIASTEKPCGGNLSASFGVTLMHKKDTLQGFIQRADQALYMSKEAGRNRVSVLQPDPDGEAPSPSTA